MKVPKTPGNRSTKRRCWTCSMLGSMCKYHASFKRGNSPKATSNSFLFRKAKGKPDWMPDKPEVLTRSQKSLHYNIKPSQDGWKFTGRKHINEPL